MEKLIKKTIPVQLGNEIYIHALMDNIGFVEVDRFVFIKEEKIHLAITYQGEKDNYHENDYIKATYNDDCPLFFSINQPKGIEYNWGEEYFKNMEFILKESTKFKISQFKPELK